MSKLFIIVFMAVMPAVCFAQSTLHFTYDDAGNRTERTIVVSSQAPMLDAPDAEAQSVIQDGNCILRYYLGGKYEYESGQIAQTERLYLNGDYYSATAVFVKTKHTGIHGLSDITEPSDIMVNATKIKPISLVTTSLRYIVRDHLGSITHVIREDGTVIQELSYDAWGRLRDPQTHEVYAPGSEPTLVLGRGYCGHEHIKLFGLINMNARLYDPVLGRFLSPDPYVQMPDFAQNYNRYSYCINNPLMYVDKDGKIFGTLLVAIIGGALIGSATSAVAYAATALITNNWNANNFWGAVGLGAFSGAVGGALGWVGSSLGLAKTFNNIGYNIISQTANNAITNVTFGNGFKFNDIFGIAAGTAMGSVLPNYKATTGGWLKNTLGETLHNTARGLTTGAAQGLADWAVKGNSKYFFQSVVGGALSGSARTIAMNAIFGAPFVDNNKISPENGRFRSGGIMRFINEPQRHAGIVLGENGAFSREEMGMLNYHEYFHLRQQLMSKTGGWAGFYGNEFLDFIKHPFNVYKTEGTLETIVR